MAVVLAPVLAAALALVAEGGLARAGEGPVLRGPGTGEVRGLVLGVNDYAHVRPLKGAVADARDIADTLTRLGAKDVTLLVDADASRAAILAKADALTQRLRPGDLVVLSIAGHGAQEPEKVKGSEPDGNEEVFLLAGFDPATREGSVERMLDKEFNLLVKRMEDKGAAVLFVADACHGGGLAREVDPRAGELSYRQVPRYALSDDELKPITTQADAFLTEVDFRRSVFLAAVDKMSKAPEVRVPGIVSYRGALSYAVARAMEGAADTDHDGTVSVAELYGYVRQVAYDLTEQRQNVVTLAATGLDVRTTPAFRLGGIEAAAPAKTVASPPEGLQPVTVAALDGQMTWFAGVSPRAAPVSFVAPAQGPDLVFDAASGDLLAGADIVARGIAVTDIPAAADRLAVARELKKATQRAVQPIRLAPDDRLHHAGADVEIEVADLAQRSLVLFNLAGDGSVQLLYPLGSDPPVPGQPSLRIPVRVSPPYGADQVVAVTGAAAMPGLVQAMTALNNTRNAGRVLEVLDRFAAPDARLGTTAIYTAPCRRRQWRTARRRSAGVRP